MESRRPLRRIVALVPFLAFVVLGSVASAQLPPPPVPPENPITPEKAVLGKILFWEEQLSSDNTMACGTCHRPEQGGTDPRLRLRAGLDGEYGAEDDFYGSPGMIHTTPGNQYAPVPEFGLGPQVTDRNSPSAIGAWISLRRLDLDPHRPTPSPQTPQYEE